MRRRFESGAAILTAMLLVALVASLSATAVWQQWRAIEVETAERGRVQSGWILYGALDWARLILREDARTGAVDHLAEPWAIPLKEARLSTFLASEQASVDSPDSTADTFLSGQITDLQSRLNVTNLVQDGLPHKPTLLAFARLFGALQLPERELDVLVRNLQLAREPATETGKSSQAPLLPITVDQLSWLGLTQSTIQGLRPYVTVLPQKTPVNLNTAPAMVLYACISQLSMADADRLARAREDAHFQTLADVGKAIGSAGLVLVEDQHSVSSRYFEVRAQLRLAQRTVQERTVVQREGLLVKTLWRERGVQPGEASLQ
jgi:general secretion pathway protein K